MFHDLVIIIFWRPTQRTEMIDWMGKNMMSVGFSKFLSLTLTLHLPASHSQCGAGLNHEFKTETLQINCVTLLMEGPAHTAYPQRKTALKLWLIITWNAMIVVTGNQGQVIILILTWDGWEGNQLPALSSRSLSWHCHTWEPGMRSLAQPGHHHQSSISPKTSKQIPDCRDLPCIHPETVCFCWMNRVLRTLFKLPHHLCLMNPWLLDDILLCGQILFRLSCAGLGWEGHGMTPVKVRVKQTQTAAGDDSRGIEIAGHRWDAWENITIGSKIISPWLLTSHRSGWIYVRCHSKPSVCLQSLHSLELWQTNKGTTSP